MPAYGTGLKGLALYANNQNNGPVYLIGYKGQSWNSVAALQSDSYESVTTTNYKSIPACLVRNNAGADVNLVWSVGYSTGPGAVACILQGAMQDVDSDYVTVDTSANVTGETRVIASPFRFHRVIFTTAPSEGAIVTLGVN